MALEIERKFKLKPGVAVPESESSQAIRQAYLMNDDGMAVRVRIVNNEHAFLTIKKATTASIAVRQEYEYEIPIEDALEMLQLCIGTPIVKQRFVVMDDGRKWEVDIFQEENEGLIIAELELSDLNQYIDLPSWIGEEVTEDPRYLNNYLALHPYTQWSEK